MLEPGFYVQVGAMDALKTAERMGINDPALGLIEYSKAIYYDGKLCYHSNSKHAWKHIPTKLYGHYCKTAQDVMGLFESTEKHIAIRLMYHIFKQVER